MRFAGPLLVAALPLVASCRDATGPELGVIVTVTSLTGPSYSADATGRATVQCDLALQARDAGSRRASWLDATFAFYAPGDSTRAIAVDTVPAQTIRYSWGADSIGPDSTRTARWRLSATFPFDLKIRFTYRLAGGGLDSSGVAVLCAPSTMPGAAPTITTLRYRPFTSLQPGDTLYLSFSATSPLGLWQSFLRLTGACDTTLMFAEQLQLAISHVVALAMPATCALGVPIGVTASSFDVRLQGASQSLTLPGLVDQTPPVVSSVGAATLYSPYAPLATFTGYLFTGDGLGLGITVTDNHALHAIYWELQPAGFRDSVLVDGPAAYRGVTIPMQAGWAGALQLRLWARDQSGNVSDTTVSAPGAIQAFPTVGPTPTLTSVPGDITDVAFDAKRGVIYLLQSNSYKIAVFSPTSLTVLRTIAMTDYASAFDLTPSGDSIITVLMNSQALGVVDLTQASPVLQAVPLAGLDATRLLDVRVTSTGQALFVAQHVNLGGGSPDLYTYALATGTLRPRLETPALGAYTPGLIERSIDRSVVVVNGGASGFLRYDAATDAFSPGQTARIMDNRPSIDATGAHIAVWGDLYSSSLQYVRTTRAALNGEGPSAISPDGQTHYMAIAPMYSDLGIVRSRVSDGSIIDHIAAPMIVTLLRASSDGATLVAVESYNNGPARIGIINLAQLQSRARTAR
jgi:hypothetical protein